MQKYIVDTIALAKYLEDSLPSKVNEIFVIAERGDAQLLIPEIVLGELIYILRKGRLDIPDISITEKQILQELEIASTFDFISMDFRAWKRFLELEIPELHDRMVAALFDKKNHVAILTNDAEISNARIPCIWK